jgi:selenide, water dikinase
MNIENHEDETNTHPHRMTAVSEPPRLTQTVRKGGCSAKIAAVELRKILAKVNFPPRLPELIVDGSDFDDAAVYKLSPEVAMVQTLDFFTPILDDPELFGEVAAVNALSDVYAMGAKPKLALAILGFPVMTMNDEIVSRIMQGACTALTRAQTSLAGGHTIDDDTLKFGLSVTGFVHPEKIWANRGALAGDMLILTKGLGTGTLTAGLKRGAWDERDISEAVDSMRLLNNIIDHLPAELLGAIHAGTDVTGFGLSGHSYNIARASRVDLAIEFAKLPILEHTIKSIELDYLTRAHSSNREYTIKALKAENISTAQQLVLHDPQTSGGLLLAVQRERADEIVDILKKHFPRTAQIGEVLPRKDLAPNSEPAIFVR